MTLWSEIGREVERRAAGRCEYCRTPVGRATVDTLLLNHERRIKIRQAEALFDLFPPGDVEQ
jgi:hypothetical protein